MKRFLLFAGSFYYPVGGADDLVDAFETLDEAKQAHVRESDWAHIFDAEQGRIVATLSHHASETPNQGEFPKPYAVWKDES